MKNLLLTFASLLLVFQSFSQSTLSIEEKIHEVYGVNFFDENPDGLNFYKKLLSERIQIVEELLTDKDKYPKIGNFPLFNKYNASISPFSPETFSIETFNPLRYLLNFSNPKHVMVYRIDGTTYILVIQPQ